MAYNYGSEGEEAAKSALRSKAKIWEQEPMRYPLNRRVLDRARGVIVHSEFALRLVRQTHSYLPIRQLNLPTRIDETSVDAAQLKRRYALPADSIVIASLGSANPAKMAGFVARAVAAMERKDVVYLIVGEMGDNLRWLAQAELGEMVRTTGYVDTKTFNDYCNLVDIGIDLRSQTMGESSAGVCRILAAGKPCVVSNFGWFAEIPDACAVKVDAAADEAALTRCLSELAGDERRRRRIGEAARKYIREHHSADRAAQQYVELLGEVRDVGRIRSARRTLVNETGQAMAELGIGQHDDWLIGGMAEEIASLFGRTSE
jgi:glycosyltransferase involved in cell wall biosynthesis